MSKNWFHSETDSSSYWLSYSILNGDNLQIEEKPSRGICYLLSIIATSDQDSFLWPQCYNKMLTWVCDVSYRVLLYWTGELLYRYPRDIVYKYI